MVKVVYEVVPHDGGWAYKLGEVFSEAFASHAEALEAVRIVAAEQSVAGEASIISYQDKDGVWKREYDDGSDRPEPEIVDGMFRSRAYRAGTSDA